MTPYYADSWLTIYAGDCRAVLAELPDESVHCVVTSPPYWGLRDYGTATWVGGDEGCDHLAGPPASNSNTLNGGSGWTPTAYGVPYRGDCGKCGAVRQDAQLGLEPTPEQYVANLVAVFREVRRVLRRDGTLWLNLGDSYATGAGSYRNPGSDVSPIDHGGKQAYTRDYARAQPNRMPLDGLKPKDLVGIPWRVAFALQADGWYLRSDVIWAKPNPMPESVTDRPTKSHEYLFLLSKSARYYYDADAVREDNALAYRERSRAYIRRDPPQNSAKTSDLKYRTRARFDEPGFDFGQWSGLGRNLRSVWTIPTRPYPGAHFAVFPPELPERCIKAGCPEGGTVLDPFAGSGTVGMVAQRLSRRAILIDLNPEYIKQQFVRNAQTPLGLEIA